MVSWLHGMNVLAWRTGGAPFQKLGFCAPEYLQLRLSARNISSFFTCFLLVGHNLSQNIGVTKNLICTVS